jgi:hypothetical protein
LLNVDYYSSIELVLGLAAKRLEKAGKAIVKRGLDCTSSAGFVMKDDGTKALLLSLSAVVGWNEAWSYKAG